MTPTARTALSVQESFSLVAVYHVLESELHQQVGGLIGPVSSRSSGEATVVRYLAEAAMAHGWRAGLFEALLPVSPGLPSRAEVIAMASSQVTPLVAELFEVPPALTDLLELLVIDLYPGLSAEYLVQAAALSPVSDGALALAARRAAADVHRVADDGMSLLTVPDAERGDRGSVTSPLVGALIRGLTPPLH